METENVKATHNQSVDRRKLDTTALSLINRLKSEREKLTLRDGEITVKDWKLENNISRGAAEHELETLVRKGVLVKRMAFHNGREVRAYREADNG